MTAERSILTNTGNVTRQVRLYVPKETLTDMGVSLQGLQDRLQAALNRLSPEELAGLLAEVRGETHWQN